MHSYAKLPYFHMHFSYFLSIKQGLILNILKSHQGTKPVPVFKFLTFQGVFQFSLQSNIIYDYTLPAPVGLNSGAL